MNYTNLILALLLSLGWIGCQSTQEPAQRPQATDAEAVESAAGAADEEALKPGDGEQNSEFDLALEAVRIDPARLESVTLDPEDAAAYAAEIEAQLDKSAAEGLDLSLWATEQLLEDPIALDISDRGELYVTGSSRSGGLLDIRGHPTWTTVALTHTTVEDHEQFLKEELAPERSAENDWLPDLNDDGSRDWRDLTVRTERLYKIMDASGDGVADRAQILIEGFNTPVTDVLGGLLIHEDDIYLSAAPDLWLMDDITQTNEPGRLRKISTGYGVHPGFFGHGMSGVTMGPDGRIYWSVGDMGYNVTAPDGRQWMNPNEGAIFRSFPDGSGFEVFAAGLRNTHEFEFDEFGNLISVDNDGDHPGEMERIVYIVEGSDSGWRTNWQFGKYTDPRNNDYKVWMDEELFKPPFPGQAAYILPPIANYHSGPAGMVYNPGTALASEWYDTFFMSEYTGEPATTHVYGFRLEEEGAGFALADDRVAVSNVLTVGMGFGPDGALYLADWIDGWGSKGAGRIWKLAANDAPTPAQEETQRLLGSGFADQASEELAVLLAHPDLRVRRKAQFELADRGEAEIFTSLVEQRNDRMARIHGLWGLWQLALIDRDEASAVVPYLGDEDAEVRAQAAKIVGDVRFAPAADALMPLLEDSSARVEFFAAEALGRIGYAPAFDGLVRMLERNAGLDAYLRHAGALALSRVADARALAGLADNASPHVRIAAVVALRRLQDPAVAEFLLDRNEYVVTEAARAINDDGGIPAAIPDLAAILLETPFANEPLLRRVINANLRSGSREDLERLAAFARRADDPTEMRAEAVDVLGVWPAPSPLDRVDGMYLGPMTRDPATVRAVAGTLIDELLTAGASTAGAVKIAAAEAAARLDVRGAAPVLAERMRTDPSAEVRASALSALHELEVDGMEEIVRQALEDEDKDVRMTAVSLIPSLDLPNAVIAELLGNALEGGSVEEQQSALGALGGMDAPEAERALEGHIALLEGGTLPAEIQLDVLEAAAASPSEALQARAEAYRAETSPFVGLEYGGNVGRGRWIFWDHEAAQCTRCHAIEGNGGDVGPDLAGIGSVLSREQLVESLVEPSARIAPGYGEGVSSMPPMGHILTTKQLRDVVAFLATLD